MPYGDDEVDSSSCYVMPVMLDDAELRDPLRAQLLERRRADQRAVSGDPRVHRLRGSRRGHCRGREHAARTELTLPLFPTLTERDQDHVVSVLRESLASLERERSLA